jgi:hypothetical protein
MTEYIARSAHGSDSVSRAYRIGEWLHVSTSEGGAYASTALTTDAARTFARGILALADEIDGGEAAKNETPTVVLPEIGARYRVTTNGLHNATVYIGDEVEVSSHHTSYFGARLDGTTWYFRPEHIGNGLEPVDEPALADWERDLLEASKPATADTRPKVGDRVRVTADTVERTVGRFGHLVEVGDPDDFYPYRVRFEDGNDTEEWVRNVVKAEGTTTPATAPLTFTALVDEAKRLLADTDHTGADVITLARELAERL